MDAKIKTVSKKQCSFCNVGEGEERPVGKFTVILRRVNVMGTEKLACQSCYIKYNGIRKHESNPIGLSNDFTFFQKLKQIILNG